MTDQAKPDTPEPPGQDVVVLPREPLQLTRLSLFDVEKLSQVAARSHFYKDTPISAAAAVKIVWGQELGIPPMASLSGIHIARGNPTLHYAMIGALLKRHGYRVDVVEWDAEHCILDWYEPNPDHALFLQYNDHAAVKLDQAPPRHLQVGQSSWSLEEAKKAGVVKADSAWVSYPKVMMYARALSIGAKVYAAEVFSGPIYTPDELHEGSFDVEAEAEEIKAVVEVPDTPTVTAKPPAPTVELASPSQRGALWMRARKRGITRETFEHVMRDRFDVPSLDRLPASLVEEAQTAIDEIPPETSESVPDDLPQSGAAGQPTTEPAGPQEGGVAVAATPPPADDVCAAVDCMFAPVQDGLCFFHYEERKKIGSIQWDLVQQEQREAQR